MPERRLVDQAGVQQPAEKRGCVGGQRLQQDIRLGNLLGRRPSGSARLLKAELEQRNRDGHFLLRPRFHDVLRLRLENPLHMVRGVRGLQHFVTHLQHAVRLHVPRDAQDHVVQVVKGPVAAVQKLRRDFGDAVGRARNVDFDRVRVVKRPQQVEQHAPLRVVVVHPDFLPDDALFLLHGLLRKIGGLDEIQQDFERLVDVGRAGKQKAGHVEGGIGVGGGPGLGKARERVALGALEQLVLQIMGDAVRDLLRLAAGGSPEAVVDGAVLRAEYRIGRAVLRLWINQDFQARGMTDLVIGVARPFAFDFPNPVH